MAGFEELQHNHLDLKKVPPLSSNRLVSLINHFVVTVVEQLSNMQATVDARLFELNEKINVCVANLVILESKLNSIPGLSNISVPNASAPSTSIPTAPLSSDHDRLQQKQQQSDAQMAFSGDKRSNEAAHDGTKTKELKHDVEEVEREQEEKQKDAEEVAAAAQEQAPPQERDPQVVKFYNMRKYGIPLGAIHQKMRSEGFDPDLYPDLV